MNLLALDCATSNASVALLWNDAWFFEANTEIRQHAQVLLPIIERVLNQAQADIAALDGIVFGEGPGSFTGLRVACGIAKGLAYAHDLPLYPVSSLQAIAHDANSADLPVLAMMDARMKAVYWSFDVGDAAVSAPEQVTIPEVGSCVLAGCGLEPYIEALPVATRRQVVATKVVNPRADTMIKLVETGCVQPVTANQAKPMYVRNQVV